MRVEVFCVADGLPVLEEPTMGEVRVFEDSFVDVMTIAIESEQYCREVREVCDRFEQHLRHFTRRVLQQIVQDILLHSYLPVGVGQLINEALNRIRHNVKDTLVVIRCLDLLRRLIERIDRRYFESRKEEHDRKSRNDIYRPASISSSQQQITDEASRKKSDGIPLPLPVPLPIPVYHEHNFAKKELAKHLSLLLLLL